MSWQLRRLERFKAFSVVPTFLFHSRGKDTWNSSVIGELRAFYDGSQTRHRVVANDADGKPAAVRVLSAPKVQHRTLCLFWGKASAKTSCD